jgi:hypothetical protein
MLRDETGGLDARLGQRGGADARVLPVPRKSAISKRTAAAMIWALAMSAGCGLRREVRGMHRLQGKPGASARHLLEQGCAARNFSAGQRSLKLMRHSPWP